MNTDQHTLAADPDYTVRWRLAGRADLAADLQWPLLNDDYWQVRAAVAARTDLTDDSNLHVELRDMAREYVNRNSTAQSG